jgi:asparagine synthase (glutamine-hydrolysing)
MCGIAGIVHGRGRVDRNELSAMIASLGHRGPDGRGEHLDSGGHAGIGQTRLKILDLSEAGRQPMCDPSGHWWIVFNGEIYNYLELRRELADSYDFRSATDTEVLLAAWIRWGSACLDRLVGMFAFLIWDAQEKRLVAVRDRFGVKPLYLHRRADGALLLASEIKALHAAGVPARPDAAAWADYLTFGTQDQDDRTFWEGVQPLPPGHLLTIDATDVAGKARMDRWYDVAERVGSGFDSRPVAEVAEEYLALLTDSVRLRFRSDVPVGINLSGGLDSSTLLALVHRVQGADSDIQAFTFLTGDPDYDELPWVERMLARTRHPLVSCRLSPGEVPDLARSVAAAEDEPFGGLPTLAYARVFERARERGVVVLLDGQGMDEQWAGYDYYRDLGEETGGLVQGSRERPVRPECLIPELRARAVRPQTARPFPDDLRNLQYRDLRAAKLPRALRFNDRASMRSSTELREPFLDHRLIELALRQPADRKIRDGVQKWLLRSLASDLLPEGVVEAPKRPVQTPQREWLRGPLHGWADDLIEAALGSYGGSWLDAAAVRQEWRAFSQGTADNSFFVWQWISLGMTVEAARPQEAGIRR